MAKGQHLKDKDKKTAPIWVKINLVVMISLFIGITVMLLFFERPTVSETEKRTLAEFPEFSFDSFFKGEYTEGVSNWFNDTVPFRDGFKDISNTLVKNMGVSMGGVVINGAPMKVVDKTPAVTEAPVIQTEEKNPAAADQSGENNSGSQQTQAAQTAADTEALAQAPVEADRPQGENAEVVNGQAIYKLGDRWYGVQLYGGGYNQDKYIKSVNDFAEDLDGIAKVYSMIPPTNGDFYCPEGFEDYNASQLKDIRYMEAGLSDKVTSVDCYTALSQHTDEYIYFRTDHHWQPLGAYYAAEQFAKAAGVPFLELSETNFETCVIDDFIGSLYGTTGRAEMMDADELIYYIPNNDFSTYYYDIYYKDEFKYPFFQKDQHGKGAYCVFMGGDNKIVRVDTDVDNDRVLLVFKDSYGNAEIPFYFNSFKSVYICDVRYFGLNAVDFIKEQGVTDVLFTMCTFSAAGGNCDGIEMCRLGTGPYIK
ncbi:MAG: DHHW family protein [Firmicutes bacterium]|nr:DHHW family protein [[Eubacterium] siraeum]MCM1486989.1 DHHW family protein [Bacillota bacterium]